MFEAGQREWRLYVDDMIGFAEKVLSYTESILSSIIVDEIPALLSGLRNISSNKIS